MATVSFLRWTLQRYTELTKDWGGELEDLTTIKQRLTLLDQQVLSEREELVELQTVLEEILELTWQDSVDVSDYEDSEELVREMESELTNFSVSGNIILESILLEFGGLKELTSILLHLLLFVFYVKDHDL